MNLMLNLVVALQILAALVMIGLVLIQHGKGADMGASFGSGASGSLFGATGSANFMSRSPAWLDRSRNRRAAAVSSTDRSSPRPLPAGHSPALPWFRARPARRRCQHRSRRSPRRRVRAPFRPSDRRAPLRGCTGPHDVAALQRKARFRMILRLEFQAV
jgi:protein translocase SecG subunit